MSSPRFAAGPDLWWINESGVAVGGGKVIGLATQQEGATYYTGVVAVDVTDGQVAWIGRAPDYAWESWTTPAIDVDTGVVVAAEGNKVVGLSLQDGHEIWNVTAPVGRTFVNASPTIADGTVYIAQFAGNATLYAIDVATGQIQWQVSAGYISGANTVAVNSTRVILVTSDGRFRTFNRATGAADVNVIISTNGFFGGVAAEEDAAYAVSFTFGGTPATRLYKVNPANGQVIWSAVAPRTDTIPVVASNMVLVSGGDGYPQMGDGTDDPALWAFDKTSGAFLWSTTAAGGWTCQPVYADGTVYVPKLGELGPMTGVLYAFDVTKTPADPGFLVGSTSQISCSVAVADGNVYGTGWYGLSAIGPAVSMPGDFNHDGAIDVVDLMMFSESWGFTTEDPGYNPECDLNSDGIIDIVDLLTFAEIWNQP